MRNIFITRNRENDNISVYEKEPAVVVTLDRKDLPYIKNLSYANNPGIYILIGENQRYIGQTAGQSVNQRLSQHNLNNDKSWFTKIIFFGRIDGQLSKTQADFLEAKLIAYYSENSKFQVENKTVGNSGFIDRLSESKANELLDTFFEVLEEVANINLLESVKETTEEISDDELCVKFDKYIFKDKSPRQVEIKFVKTLLGDKIYGPKLREFVVAEKATSKNNIGSLQNIMPSGQVASREIEPGIFLWVNQSKNQTSYAIQKIAKWLDLNVEINF
jgi:hypothetical protein